MKRISIIVMSVFVFQHIVLSQTLKLEDILDSIQHSYPSLKMYDAQIRSLDAAAEGARSWMPPQLSTGLWMTPYNTNLWKGETKTDGTSSTGMGQYMISAEQMFPNKKYNDASEAYMKAVSSVEKENKQATLNELLASAKKNYYEWIIIKKKLLVLAQSENLLQFMIRNAETRYKNGLGKISAYYKIKASLGGIEKMRVEMENEIIQKRIAINTLMNRDKLTEFSVDTIYLIKDYSTIVIDSSLVYANRSDIKAIDKNIQLAYLQEDVEKANLKPQFGLRYDHMFGFGGFPMQYTLMGMVKIPMPWSTRINKANIESLKWKAEALQNQKASMANEYSGLGYEMQQNIIVKKKQVELFDKSIIPALRKNYESMQLGYEQNTEDLFELFDAWETLNDTQLEYLNQLQELLSMQADLEKLLEIK